MDEGSSAGLAGRELAQAPLYQRLRAIEYSREVVLVISFVLLIVLFAVTAVVSRLYHDKVQSLANDWFSKGEAAFRSGNVTAALTDYRNALVYSPNNSAFQLHLAQALAAAGHLDEAESYFMNLLAESPGNGEINLELARIAVRKKQSVDPMRYYQSAIYGVWDTDPLTMRWNVRRELCEYLLGAGDLSHAQPEIIALAQEVPAGDLERQKLAGAFLLRGELWDRALAEFTSVLKFDPRDEEALAGAGQAAFDLGHYSDALGYFDRLSLEKKTSPHLAGMIEQARAIVFADPWGGGLSPAEGARRVSRALRQAQSRIEECSHQIGQPIAQTHPESGLQNLYATSVRMAREWSELNLTRHPDRIDAAMSLVFQMEDAAAQQCGEPQSGPDRALRIIEHSRERAGP
jgi:tetratricopeptide (TPR) repeat protein